MMSGRAAVSSSALRSGLPLGLGPTFGEKLSDQVPPWRWRQHALATARHLGPSCELDAPLRVDGHGDLVTAVALSVPGYPHADRTAIGCHPPRGGRHSAVVPRASI